MCLWLLCYVVLENIKEISVEKVLGFKKLKPNNVLVFVFGKSQFDTL